MHYAVIFSFRGDAYDEIDNGFWVFFGLQLQALFFVLVQRSDTQGEPITDNRRPQESHIQTDEITQAPSLVDKGKSSEHTEFDKIKTDESSDRMAQISNSTAKKLNRSTNNKWIGGVCGGLGEYSGVPPMIYRIIWVILSVIIWPVALAYPIVTYFMPKKS